MNSSSAFKLVKGELTFFVIVKEVGSRGEEKEEGGGDSEDKCGQSGTVVDNTTQWSSKTFVQLIGLHHTSSSHRSPVTPQAKKKRTSRYVYSPLCIMH